MWAKAKKFSLWKGNNTRLEAKPFLPKSSATFMNSSLSIQINLGFPKLLPQKGKDALQSVTWQESLTHWWDSLARVAYLTLQPHVLIRAWFWRPMALASLSQSFILRLTRRHLGTHRLLDQPLSPLVALISLWRFSISFFAAREFLTVCWRILMMTALESLSHASNIKFVPMLALDGCLFSFMLGCSWLWAWGSLFSCVLDIVDVMPGDCLLKPSISAARHFN